MAKHQIIYTSCLRGIESTTEGQQIFSYDIGFREEELPEVKPLFRYTPLALESVDDPSAVMPQAFTYRLLRSGVSTLALNTHLDQDHQGNKLVKDNYLSHVVLFDDQDFNIYPCELYGGETLRDHMEQTEVNTPTRPDYLPEPQINRGNKVSVETVVRFLSVGERMEIYRNMIHAVISYKNEGKRLLICDENENIIMWIAAIGYTLPIEIAKKIDFSTYVYDPSESELQICGVQATGTMYSLSEYQNSNDYFVFDIINNVIPTFDYNIRFLDFMVDSIKNSFDGVHEFHKFIIRNSSYRLSNEKLYSAFIVYRLHHDSIDNFDRLSFEKGLEFEYSYANSSERIALARRILSQIEIIRTFDKDYILSILVYLLETYSLLSEDDKENTRTMILDCIIISLSNESMNEKEFSKFYAHLDKNAKTSKLSLANELMLEKNRLRVIETLKDNIVVWKVHFVFKIISEYAKSNNETAESFKKDQSVGIIYHQLLKIIYTNDSRMGLYLVKKLLEEFSDSWNYLTHITLNCEDYLQDILKDDHHIVTLWNYFYKFVLSQQKIERIPIIDCLMRNNRYKEVYTLFVKTLDDISQLDDANDLFKEYYEVWCEKDAEFKNEYLAKILYTYQNYLLAFNRTSSDAEAQPYLKELLTVVISTNIEEFFIDELIDTVVSTINDVRPSDEDRTVLLAIYERYYNGKDKQLFGKLLLLLSGIWISEAQDFDELTESIDRIAICSRGYGVDLTNVVDNIAIDYLDWIIPTISKNCITQRDLEIIYDLYHMNHTQSKHYFATCARAYFVESEHDERERIFCEFLMFMFENGTGIDIENTGKALIGVDEVELGLLNNFVVELFAQDKENVGNWYQVYHVVNRSLEQNHSTGDNYDANMTEPMMQDYGQSDMDQNYSVNGEYDDDDQNNSFSIFNRKKR